MDAAAPAAAAAADEPTTVQLLERPLFSCKEAYVYKVPPATTAGHRAEMWDVNRWLAAVSLRVVQVDDEAYVRLMDDKTGELFAECPVPTDKPLVTAVEQVVDSSRYFVMRIADRDTSRHAFIGVGFRERSEASDFNASLIEFLQYIHRKRTAEAMRHAYEERLQSQEAGEGGAAAAPATDYTLKEGETLRLRINTARPAGSNFVSSSSARRGGLAKTFSLLMDGHGGTVAALTPPSPSSRGSPMPLDMCVSPSLEAGGGSPLYSAGSGGSTGSVGRSPHARLSGAGDHPDLQQRLQGLQLQQQRGGGGGGEGASASASAASSSLATGGGADDDDFGDFEGADTACGGAGAGTQSSGGGGGAAPGEQAAPCVSG